MTRSFEYVKNLGLMHHRVQRSFENLQTIFLKIVKPNKVQNMFLVLLPGHFFLNHFFILK